MKRRRVMQWVLIIGGVVVGLVLVVVVVGMLLPKGHRAKVRAKFNRPAAEVWAVMTDFQSHPSWRTGLKAMERRPDQDGKPVWREVLNRGWTMTYAVETFEPPNRMVTRIVDESLPFGGTWTYEVRPAGEGCEVTVTEDGEIYNPVFRFMARFVFGYHATMEAYLRALGKQFGETVSTEHVAP